ncbi:hypothetical protein IP88_07140 [alpha proteobacterium AAP81b]|nr:hypothetical protein IP88_07140 [alpha proteobacterium AAP81b]
MRSDRASALLLIATPAGLLLGAFAFQYLGGLPPCEMCIWQRWAVGAALALAVMGTLFARSRLVLVAAALALLVDAGLGVFHAGVEQKWWRGITECTATGGSSLSEILAAPVIRCDAIPWSLFGLSMAGWNAVFAGSVGVCALWLLARR